MSEVEDETKGLELGAVDYITKPISPPIVLARVKTHLELKRQQDALRDASLHLQSLNEVKNQFLGMAAHDLRNPLGVIISFSDMLLDEFFGPLNEKQREMLRMTAETSRQMLSLVGNLLDVSVIESGKLRLEKQLGSLAAVVRHHVEVGRLIAARKQISVTIEVGELPQFVFDPGRLGQVMDNLISNAIKFSPHGTEVTVSLRNEGDAGARIEVRDRGPGIREEDRSRLFGVFERTVNRPTGGETSTGLGLAIVRKILDAHGASVSVHNHPGGGAVFSVAIPFASEAGNAEKTGNDRGAA
jgi:signal transduction histidine kinase